MNPKLEFGLIIYVNYKNILFFIYIEYSIVF